MDKFKMELTWHNCASYFPKEDYNYCLYMTDGKEIFTATWKKDVGFICGALNISKLTIVNLFWWADLHRTVRESDKFLDKTLEATYEKADL